MLESVSTQMNRLSIMRESGVLKPVSMPWETDSPLGLEFRHIYISRLAKMEERLLRVTHSVPISAVQEQAELKLKGIVKRIEKARKRAFESEYTQKYDISQAPLYSEEDEIELEDSTGLIKLILVQRCQMQGKSVKAADLPFGIVVAVKGKYRMASNKFQVSEIYLPDLPSQRPLRNSPVGNQNVIVAFEPTLEQLQQLGEPKRYDPSLTILRDCVGLIVVGGVKLALQSLLKMDSVLATLEGQFDVFIMPSARDKYSQCDQARMYPIKPYNRAYFKNSSNKITLCSGPQTFHTSNDLQIAVSCGANVLDLMRNCAIAVDPLQAMKALIDFGHFCPTLPFSLRTEPTQEDQFIMNELPHVMISGGGDTFRKELLHLKQKKVLVISAAPSDMVVVQLDGRDCTVLI